MSAIKRKNHGKTQSYAARVAAGRRSVSIWLSDEDAKKLDELGGLWGMIRPRDVIATALRHAHHAETAIP